MDHVISLGISRDVSHDHHMTYQETWERGTGDQSRKKTRWSAGAHWQRQWWECCSWHRRGPEASRTCQSRGRFLENGVKETEEEGTPTICLPEIPNTTRSHRPSPWSKRRQWRPGNEATWFHCLLSFFKVHSLVPRLQHESMGMRLPLKWFHCLLPSLRSTVSFPDSKMRVWEWG